jgi:hypothetical protein
MCAEDGEQPAGGEPAQNGAPLFSPPKEGVNDKNYDPQGQESNFHE